MLIVLMIDQDLSETEAEGDCTINLKKSFFLGR